MRPHRSYAKAMNLSREMMRKLDSKKLSLSQLKDMDAGEVGAILRHPSAGAKVLRILNAFPDISLDAVIQPITRTVLRVSLTVEMRFDWVNSLHGSALKWLILVEDSDSEFNYHDENLMMTRKMIDDRFRSWSRCLHSITCAWSPSHGCTPDRFSSSRFGNSCSRVGIHRTLSSSV